MNSTPLVESPLLECRNVAFERDDTPLFSGVSFALFAGKAIQVQGANGVGKTTLLRILSTSLTASAGEIVWNSLPLDSHKQAYRANLLHIGHIPGIKPSLTPMENLRWFFKIYPGNGMALGEALGNVGMAGFEDAPCHTLSAGQLRRVALARLYISCARLWILDEPFTSIDVHGVAALEALMAEHLQRGGCMLLTSHQQPRLANLEVLQLEAYAG